MKKASYYTNLVSKEDFHHLFKTLYFPLLRYAISFVKDRDCAEDIVQDIFINIWEKTENFEENKDLKPYLYASVKNRCLNHLRSSNRNIDNFSEDIAKEDSVQNAIIKDEVYQQLNYALNQLPNQCKKIYKMYLNGMSAKEISEDLNLTVETIKAQKRRAKQLLRDKLGKMTYILFLFKKKK